MYLWWRTWHDNDRRLWAERFTAGDPAEAKQRHRDDLTFTWAGSVNAPGVTDLEFTDENGLNKTVTGGTQRLSEDDRTWYAALASPSADADAEQPDHDLPF